MKLKKQTMWNKFALALCVAAGALSIGGASPAQAADKDVAVGVLDEAKLGKDYAKFRDALAALNERAVAYDKQLDAREVLDETQSKRFDELIAKKNRTPAEETEFNNLVKVGTDRRTDLNGLAGKAARTPDEETRLKLFQGYMKTNTVVVRRLEDDLFQELKTTEEATNKTYIDLANAMVQKVAGEKKLTLVFRKDAVVWFAPAVDITDEVLTRLNRQ